ncbi:MAG: hypothetical protein F9K47_05570 [Burkholderiales bacterium]|nr:MAG: hypothetical protein F9K47_05570 [Burkholderiales bacterium]
MSPDRPPERGARSELLPAQNLPAGRGAYWVLAWLVLLLLLAGGLAQAQPEAPTPAPLRIHFFYTQGCPHCAAAENFLLRYRHDPRIEIRGYEVKHDPAGRIALEKVVAALALEDVGFPYFIIGRWSAIGYQSDEWTGAMIAREVASCLAQGCPDPISAILAGETPTVAATPAQATLPSKLRLPLLGEIDTGTLSLPMLTVVLAALDGFNPCAMWALVFLLGLLMGVAERKRMWLLGLTFLAGSGLIYYLIMAAWLKVLLTIGLIFWVRNGVGLVALAAAGFYVHDVLTNPEAACEVSHTTQRLAILARLKRFALEERLWPAMMGVLALAFAVNLIEFVCSAGIPAVYTQILALTPMPGWQYQAYLLLYLLVFLLDDLALFAVAATTLQFAAIGTRYARASRLIGAGVMVVIGLLLLFKPEWLQF